ncbi:germination lipoprotein GerS-related protein [Clostridium polynesiense]|uniref:germination lipoprotein GerS-related protein n=1 Tax=Clostridium polynesiense TaxID=1325933 RepID=UPI000693A10A|nr:germination lipoprotein GerS-related protein [Clostridium polynesiense]
MGKTKKKIIIASLILFIALTVLFALLLKRRVDTPQEYVDYLRTITCYSSDVNYFVINDKGQFEEKARLYYDAEKGYRLELGEDRVYFYIKDTIIVKDLKSNRSYTLKEDFDVFYKWAFLRDFVELIYTNEEVKIYSENKEGKNYLFIELYIPGGNKNIDKGILQVNTDTKAPEKLCILDFKGNIKAEIVYSNFIIEKELNAALFEH